LTALDMRVAAKESALRSWSQ